MKAAHLLAIALCLQLLGSAQETATYIGRYTEPFPGPQVYKDPNSGSLFYVETDGRHIAAISNDGKLLWIREPHKDAHVDFYRTDKPQIVGIGPRPKWYSPVGAETDLYVSISFSNSQFGVLKVSNGDFTFLGQD